MSFQERNVIVGLLVGIGFFAVYTLTVAFGLRDGDFAGAGGMAALATRTLWVIGGSILATIAATILAEILYAIVTNTSRPDHLVDERDRLIERTGDRIGGHLSAVVFVGALIALARGMSPEWGIVVITYGFYFGSLLSGVIRLYQHRRGY